MSAEQMLTLMQGMQTQQQTQAAQIAQLLTELTQRQATTTAASPAADRPPQNRKILIVKDIRCSDFSGKLEDWEDWAFAFKSAIRASSIAAFDLLKSHEVQVTPAWTEPDGSLQHIIAAELFDILSMFCKGDSSMVIRSAQTTGDFNGAKMWCNVPEV